MIFYQNSFVLDDLDTVNSEMNFQIPKSLSCNRNRFPYWFGEKDARNKQFHKMFQNIQKDYNLSHLEGKGNCQDIFSKKYLYINESVYQIEPSCK